MQTKDCQFPTLCFLLWQPKSLRPGERSVDGQCRHQWHHRSSWMRETLPLIIWTQEWRVVLWQSVAKHVLSTPQVQKTQRGVFGRVWGGIMTMWRSLCPSPRPTACPWSGGRQWSPSSMLALTWSLPQWSLLWSMRGSHPKKAAHLSLTSFLTTLIGSTGHSQWQRSTAWCCWPFG